VADRELADLGPLPEFGQSRLERELRKLGRLIVEGHPSPAANKFADDLGSDADFARFVVGFIDGFWSGGSERVAAWAKDCQDTLTRLRALVLQIEPAEIAKTIRVVLANSIWEYFRRPRPDIAVGGLSPTTVEALEDLALLHDLSPFFQTLAFFEDKRRASSFLALASDLATSMALVLLEEARSELNAILTEGDAERKGSRVGQLLGSAIVEMVRGFTEPTGFTVAEMVSSLGLEPDEVQLLELQEAAIP
jgi:hypothetical protein